EPSSTPRSSSVLEVAAGSEQPAAMTSALTTSAINVTADHRNRFSHMVFLARHGDFSSGDGSENFGFACRRKNYTARERPRGRDRRLSRFAENAKNVGSLLNTVPAIGWVVAAANEIRIRAVDNARLRTGAPRIWLVGRAPARARCVVAIRP